MEAARQARLGNGTIEIAALWRDLRAQFVLKDHPEFSASWSRLRALTSDYKATIETALPSGLAIARTDNVSGVVEVAKQAVSVVYGDSGAGKSALLKGAIETQFPSALQVWLGPDQLTAALSEADRERLGLTHALIDVLDASPIGENIRY